MQVYVTGKISQTCPPSEQVVTAMTTDRIVSHLRTEIEWPLKRFSQETHLSRDEWNGHGLFTRTIHPIQAVTPRRCKVHQKCTSNFEMLVLGKRYWQQRQRAASEAILKDFTNETRLLRWARMRLRASQRTATQSDKNGGFVMCEKIHFREIHDQLAQKNMFSQRSKLEYYTQSVQSCCS